MHQGQAGAPPHNDLILPDAKERGEQTIGLGHGVQVAVVAHIYPVFISKISGAGKQVKHPIGEIELFLAGFAPGHIQFHPLGF